MKHIGVLKNPIQEYAWGSRRAIAELLGNRVPSEGPQAELWMGAHPKAPSLVACGGEWVSLREAIADDPESAMGSETAEKFGGSLPYLFKVLAASHPLSIQAHPSLARAREGFEMENGKGIPLDAANRNYRDPNHKPECLCALTPFWALSGFRPILDLLAQLEPVWPPEKEYELDVLRNGMDSDALKRFFYTLMTLGNEDRPLLIDHIAVRAEGLSGSDPVYRWMSALHRSYPSDIGILAPALLNLVCLDPGQGLYLPSGEPHAYLQGVGMELMANSDNVLRGGLTAKHVDVPELLAVLDFTPKPPALLSPVQESGCENRYPCPVDEFALSLLTIRDGLGYESAMKRSIEILICTDGAARVSENGGGKSLDVRKGMSIVIPASVPGYTVRGTGKMFKAAVPL